jgi:hypothetical protein
MVLFLVGGRNFTRREGLRRLKDRMKKTPGFSNVRYNPSRLRPRMVVVDVDIGMFLGKEFPRKHATVEVTWRPREDIDLHRVQWIDDKVSLGWHKDDDHPDLGTTHFQLESQHESYHESGSIEVEAPLSFLEICLDRLPDQLDKTIEI